MTPIETISSNLEQNRAKIYKKDFTFFNLGSMEKLAKVCDKEQCSCKRCEANLERLVDLSATCHELIAMGESGKRKLEDDMDDVYSHLIKEHGYSRDGWYKSLYSMYGFAGGLVLGLLAAWIAPEGSGKMAFLIVMLVALVGCYCFGLRTDHKKALEKKIL